MGVVLHLIGHTQKSATHAAITQIQTYLQRIEQGTLTLCALQFFRLCSFPSMSFFFIICSSVCVVLHSIGYTLKSGIHAAITQTQTYLQRIEQGTLTF